MPTPTKAEMEKMLREIVRTGDGSDEGQQPLVDLARRALGRKDTVNDAQITICLECFETPAGPEATLADDLDVIVTYRGKPVKATKLTLTDYDCQRLEEEDGEEEDEED